MEAGTTERVTITRSGGREVLALQRERLAPPGPGEVQIRVHAAGLNFADIYAREGLYGPAPRPPFAPGFEVAGEVEAVGAGASFSPGERVFAVTRFGGYARRIVARTDRVFPLPEGWS